MSLQVNFYLKKFFFWMRTIFKAFIEFVTILFLFYVLVFLARRHVGSHFPEHWTHAPCIRRSSLNHWTMREVPRWIFKLCFSLSFFKISFVPVVVGHLIISKLFRLLVCHYIFLGSCFMIYVTVSFRFFFPLILPPPLGF